LISKKVPDSEKRKTLKKDFETIDHTADIGIRAFGTDLKEAFVNTAKGMFQLITEDNVREEIFRDIRVTAPDHEVLLVEWLNELIYYFDAEQLLFNRFEIISLTPQEIRSRCWGEKVDKSRHELKRGIKSTTYHMLKIEKKDGCTVEVLFDI
jgi:SHS2 domain-containing protein